MKKALAWAALAAVLASPGLAVAGNRVTEDVFIDFLNKYARGSLTTAYNSPDDQQTIECWLYTDTDKPTTGGCYAITAGREEAFCSFHDKPTLVSAVSAISSDSFVYFSWNDDGSCRTINVTNSSVYGPKRR